MRELSNTNANIHYRVKMHGFSLPTTTSDTFEVNSPNSPPHAWGASTMWRILTTINFFKMTPHRVHSGETDEANCSWLHPVWPPPKRPDRDSMFFVVSRASTELIFCIHRDFDVRNNVYKPRRLVYECCRDISAWKSRVMKPTLLRDEANCWGALA